MGALSVVGDHPAEWAPGVLVRRTDGHTPGHSVVRLASGGDRLTLDTAVAAERR